MFEKRKGLTPEGLVTPELILQLEGQADFPALHISRQDLEGLVLQLQADAVLVQLAQTQVYVKGAEANLAGSDSGFHSDFRA